MCEKRRTTIRPTLSGQIRNLISVCRLSRNMSHMCDNFRLVITFRLQQKKGFSYTLYLPNVRRYYKHHLRAL